MILTILGAVVGGGVLLCLPKFLIACLQQSENFHGVRRRRRGGRHPPRRERRNPSQRPPARNAVVPFNVRVTPPTIATSMGATGPSGLSLNSPGWQSAPPPIPGTCTLHDEPPPSYEIAIAFPSLPQEQAYSLSSH